MRLKLRCGLQHTQLVISHCHWATREQRTVVSNVHRLRHFIIHSYIATEQTEQ